jgi:hypothetical protein
MDITEYEEFYKWYRINEQRFHCAQMTEVQIAYSAYLHGIKQAGINTVLCTVASEEVVQNVSDRCVEYESGNSLCSVQCEMCKKL